MKTINILVHCWCTYLPGLEEDYFLGFETDATMEDIEAEASSILKGYIFDHLEDYCDAVGISKEKPRIYVSADYEASCYLAWCPITTKMIKYYMEHEDCEFQDVRDLVVFTLDDEGNLTFLLRDEDEDDYDEYEEDYE